MSDIFKTVLLLSGLGGAITVVILILKPITVKRFSARWQYYAWLIAAICMICPIWKMIPADKAQRLAPVAVATPEIIEAVPNDISAPTDTEPASAVPTAAVDTPIIVTTADNRSIYEIAAFIWFGGMCAFLCSSAVSYCIFLQKKRRHSTDIRESAAFEAVKSELGIKRKIRVRISADTDSPMLIGVLFPVIYVPDTDVDEMIFRHELMHYKHRDLLLKQFVLIVNAVHWFNPLAYLLGTNFSRACEVYCDMSVVADMSNDERNLYMKTILNEAQMQGVRKCSKSITQPK